VTDRKGRGWGLVTTTGILTGMGHGFVAYAVSALLKPIALDLDTGRGMVSTAIGLGRLASGLASPVVGRIADVSGPRLVVVLGMMLTALGLVVLGFAQTQLWLYLAWSMLISVGVAAGFTVALDKLVISTNEGRRGMALAVRFSIAALVSTMLVPAVTLLVEHVGWRATCFTWAALVVALIPIPLFAFRTVGAGAAPVAARVEDPGSTRPILRNMSFWLVAMAFMAQAAVVTGLSVHLVPLMTDGGLPASQAGLIFGGMILLSIPVRLLTGRLADRASPSRLPLLLAGLFALQAICIGLYAIWPHLATLLIVVLAQGIGTGAPTLVVLLLCAHLFGEQRFGSVQGVLMALQVPGTATAPILAGTLFDLFGSYDIAIGIFSLMLVVAAGCMAVLTRRVSRGKS
jgi:MFS family permease